MVAVDPNDGPMRLMNVQTKTLPCVLHLAGGYTDQVAGKDRVMKPWAEKLEIL